MAFFYLHQSAQNRIEAAQKWLRVKLQSGGCSGYKVVFTFETEKKPQDLFGSFQKLDFFSLDTPGMRESYPDIAPGLKGNFSMISFETTSEKETLGIIVDPLSMHFLKGATVFFQKEIMAEHFSLYHPGSKNKCGCGESLNF